MAGGRFTAVNKPFGTGFLNADAPPGGATGRSVTGFALLWNVDDAPVAAVVVVEFANVSPCRGAC